MPAKTISAKDKLNALRKMMKSQGLDGFIVPRADEYQGEYVPASAKRLEFLTGFTGSAGTAIILKNKAVVMSDGRYTIQLAAEVDGKFFSTENSVSVPPGAWIAKHAGKGDVIGYDPRLHTPKQIEVLEKIIAPRGMKLKAVDKNPLDAIWKNRPKPPMGKVQIFPDKFAGISSAKKRAQIAKGLKKDKIHAVVITLPDSICWLLNLRGADVEYTPIILSYAMIDHKGRVLWFVEPKKIPTAVKKHLGMTVEIIPPSNLDAHLKKLAKKTIALDTARSSVWFLKTLEKYGARVQDRKDPCIAPKSIKTKAEQTCIRRSHIRDGAAVTRFLCWLDAEGQKGKLDELKIADKLESFRAKDKSYRGPSFPTIAGFGPNGAIVHYRATKKTNRAIKPGNLLLLDSGAQYTDGTTDITRTVAIGKPTKEMAENFTRVLQGHIAVAAAKFAAGTTGAQIDALARAPLQKAKLDYAHGTGHGVGVYLSVHEEAANLSPRGHDAVQPGMLLSNEPGYYKTGAYGIRIENLVLAQGAKVLSFETMTLAPIDRNLIVKSMLNAKERKWLNAYRARVYKTLAPLLDKTTKAWLQAQTRPL